MPNMVRLADSRHKQRSRRKCAITTINKSFSAQHTALLLPIFGLCSKLLNFEGGNWHLKFWELLLGVIIKIKYKVV